MNQQFRAPTSEMPEWIAVKDDVLSLFSSHIRGTDLVVYTPAEAEALRGAPIYSTMVWGGSTPAPVTRTCACNTAHDPLARYRFYPKETTKLPDTQLPAALTEADVRRIVRDELAKERG